MERKPGLGEGVFCQLLLVIPALYEAFFRAFFRLL